MSSRRTRRSFQRRVKWNEWREKQRPKLHEENPNPVQSYIDPSRIKWKTGTKDMTKQARKIQELKKKGIDVR